MHRSLRLVVSLFFLALLPGCVTHIREDATMNPPPAEKFSAFNRFELAKIAMGPPYAGQAPNERALAKIQENLSERMNPVIAGWNSAGRETTPARTLLIEPSIVDIKFISVGARIGAGIIPGSSAVILRLKISEKETGKAIATPEFYAKANTWAGMFSFGTADNMMLVRVANRVSDYLMNNYAVAMGGPTGAPGPREK